MKKLKNENPYLFLLRKIRQFCFNIKHREVHNMFHYEKNILKTADYNLFDLYERTKAADQLGYDVILKATDIGLEIQYIKKIEIPTEWE